MAAGTFILPNIAKPKTLNGTIQLSSHTFKAAIVNGNTTLNASTTGTSGALRWSDLSPNEVSGAGYTANGVTTTVGVSGTSTVTATCTGATWTSLTITNGVYIVVYSDTATNKDVLGYAPFDSTLATQSGTYTSFGVTFSSGMFTVA